MSVETRSGMYGKLLVGASEFLECTGWEMTVAADVAQWGSFGSQGWKRALAGQKSCRGTVRGKYDFNNPVEAYLRQGTSVDIKLYMSSTAGGGDRYYELPDAVITEIAITIDGDGGGPVEWSAGFVSNGAVTEP